jgi:hypothetical protein
MPVLDEASRAALWAEFMRDDTGSFGSVTKADLRAAVDALDTFLNTNAAAVNNAIPQPARSELTTRQKAMLLMYVISRRFKMGV